MTDILAYQIGGVFFLAVLFMAGTMTRGLFPTSVFRNVKLAMFAVAALLVGFLVYRGLPDVSGILALMPSRQTPAEAAPASSTTDSATKPSRAPVPVKIREVQTVRQPASILVLPPQPEETSNPLTEPSVPQSQPLSPSRTTSVESWRATPAQDSASPVNRAIKSVGHFLHIGHEKYEARPSVPQPVTAP